MSEISESLDMTNSPNEDVNLDDIHPFSRKFLWLADPKIKKNFIWFTVLGLILTIIAGFIFPNKHPGPWEPGWLSTISYGVIGFGAYTIVVLSAAPLFNLLSRDEAYYGEGDDHDHAPPPPFGYHSHDDDHPADGQDQEGGS